jgi:hypothetical protein
MFRAIKQSFSRLFSSQTSGLQTTHNVPNGATAAERKAHAAMQHAARLKAKRLDPDSLFK